MTIGVYIDHNVWDFLFKRRIDLTVALPRDEFRLCVTREAEFEITPTPPDKKAFIEATIAKCGIQTDTFFGFNDASLPPDEQRIGGFNVGRWASPKEIAFIASQRTALKAEKKRPTKLHPGEADISLAARSFHSVVLSLDKKKGPLKDAYEQGGRVVFLTDFDKSGMSLSDFIKAGLASCPWQSRISPRTPRKQPSARSGQRGNGDLLGCSELEDEHRAAPALQQ
jgi:hypothetical protein